MVKSFLFWNQSVGSGGYGHRFRNVDAQQQVRAEYEGIDGMIAVA